MAIENNTDFVVYSRNDQVAERKSIGTLTRYLQLGYTSVSGVDQEDRVFQMKRCFADFMECNCRVAINDVRKDVLCNDGPPFNGTFSLIFDTEQVGCARYALPRLLDLLRPYNVKATFFVCNILKQIYPNLLEIIKQQNHEVGLHGKWHEYLSVSDVSDQETAIGAMIKDFGDQVCGANFIGRMNKATILALMKNRVEYFIRPFVEHYRFFGYPKTKSDPVSVYNSTDEISMVPVSFETYGLPWFSIKNWIDSCLAGNTRSSKHLTILLHPFRDGNLRHIHDTELLLNYLVLKKKLRGITLREFLIEHNLSTKGNGSSKIPIRSFEASRAEKCCFPRSLRDMATIIPESSMTCARVVRRGTSLW